jgi:cation:H+ antiporter
MTGSNRLLHGPGWPVVVVVALAVAARRSGRAARELVLGSGYRTELGFLLIASLVAHVVPVSGQISLILGFALLGFFVFYLWKAAQAETAEPDLVGTAARIGTLAARRRRLLMTGLFVFAAAVIAISAEPFANSLITTGTQLGIEGFPPGPMGRSARFRSAGVHRGHHVRGAWEGLRRHWHPDLQQGQPLDPAGRQPSGGPPGRRRGTALMLDGRQKEEFLLTAAQTLMGVSALLALRFPRWLAFTLLGLFALQYVLPGQTARYILSAIYLVVSVAALVRHRRLIRPTLAAPFSRDQGPRPENAPLPSGSAAAGWRAGVARVTRGKGHRQRLTRPGRAAAPAAELALPCGPSPWPGAHRQAVCRVTAPCGADPVTHLVRAGVG